MNAAFWLAAIWLLLGIFTLLWVKGPGKTGLIAIMVASAVISSLIGVLVTLELV